METIGRMMIIGGIAIALIGGLIYLSAKFGLPLGHLPGDIRIERENIKVYFPFTSAILVSLILTLVVNIVGRFLKK